jgi:hypothetical protein
MKTSLITKPTLPMMAKPTAQEVAIFMNSGLSEVTLFVRLAALLDEVNAVVVEVNQVALGLLNVV